MEVRFRVLGPLEVSVQDGLVELPPGRARRLLAALALRANEVVRADALIEALWDGRPTTTAHKALQVHVSQLRRVLPQGYLVTRGSGYALLVSADELDALAFERDVAAGRRLLADGDLQRAAERLGAALAQWRPGDLDDAPVALRGEFDRLCEQRDLAHEDWLEARQRLGEHADVLAQLPQLVSEHPYRERLIGLHMLALYRAGRPADALDALAQARRRLDEDLGLEPAPALRELQRAILAHDPSLAVPEPQQTRSGALLGTLAPGAMIGRERELAELCELLHAGERLVTVTGVGGSGKTRLAVACAEELTDWFSGGVKFAPLAAVESEADVVRAIAAAVGVSLELAPDPERALGAVIGDQHMLLVLDNFEHLLDAAPVVARLLVSAPRAQALVTSQLPLRIHGETVTPLHPLTSPELGAEADVESVIATPAVALMIRAATAADPSFRVHPGNVAAVTSLCRKLDGLPLALELAGARLRVAGPAGALAALERSIDGLGEAARDVPERQRGLRAALAWTLSLLSPSEQALFTTLGAFAEAWTLEQAEAVAGEETRDVWAAMATLRDASLVRPFDENRLTMAETVRLYAQELLARFGEHDIRRRHAAVMAGEAESICREILVDHSAQAERARMLYPEFDLALRWSVTADPALHRRLVCALGVPYYFGLDIGRLPELYEEPIEPVEDLEAVRLRCGLGMTAIDPASARRVAELLAQVVGTASRLGDQRLEVLVCVLMAHLRGHAGTLDGLEAIELAVAAARHTRDPALIRMATDYRVLILAMGEHAADAEQALEAIIVSQEDRRDAVADFAPSYWADAALARKDWPAALSRYAYAARLMRGRQLANTLLQVWGITAAAAGCGDALESVVLHTALQNLGPVLGLGYFDELPGAELVQHAAAPLATRDRERARVVGAGLDFEGLVDRAITYAEAASHQRRTIMRR